ncbi:MAG: hypothetical protein VKS61_12650 [Candidatus Sericytochromatia bacterium]|nr:hypothetical protein [Candidatus Sericytochromatia bacterium]
MTLSSYQLDEHGKAACITCKRVVSVTDGCWTCSDCGGFGHASTCISHAGGGLKRCKRCAGGR